MTRKTPADQGDLFGYINPIDQAPSTHPPLCACGACNIPVQQFRAPQPVVAAIDSTDLEAA